MITHGLTCHSPHQGTFRGNLKRVTKTLGYVTDGASVEIVSRLTGANSFKSVSGVALTGTSVH